MSEAMTCETNVFNFADLRKIRDIAEEAGDMASLARECGEHVKDPVTAERECRALLISLLTRFGPITDEERAEAVIEIEDEGFSDVADPHEWALSSRVKRIDGGNRAEAERLYLIVFGRSEATP